MFFKDQGELPVSFSFDSFCSGTDLAQAVSEQKQSAGQVQPSDLASIVYTSGTTGTPKGAKILHSCFSAVIRSICTDIALSTEDTTLAFLPFAHVLGRVESFIPLVSGITLGFGESVSSVPANILEAKPTVLISVPRIYEKI